MLTKGLCDVACEEETVSASEAIARLRELRAKATAEVLHKHFMACATLPSREDFGVWPEWARDSRNWPYLRHVTSSTPAIVAAMNSLEPLLACAEALEPFACRTGGFLGNITDEDVSKARAALQALAEGGE